MFANRANLFRSTLLAMSMAMMFLLGSCSGGKNALDKIPAETILIVKMDTKGLLENLGCTVSDNGEVTLSKQLDQMTAAMSHTDRSDLNTALKMSEGLDLSQGYLFALREGDPIGMILLKDRDKVEANIASFYGAPLKENGASIFKADFAPAIVIKDDALYLGNNLDRILSAIDKADKNNATEIPGMDKYFDRDDKVLAAISLGYISKVSCGLSLPASYMNNWAIAAANVTDKELTFEVAMNDKNGETVKFGDDVLNNIDESILTYLPDYNNKDLYGVMAMGAVNSELRKMMTAAADMFDPTWGSLLRTWTGAMAVAFDWGNFADTNVKDIVEKAQKSQNVGEFNIKAILLGQFDPNFKINNLIEQNKNMFFPEGKSEFTNNLLTINMGDGLNIYAGNPVPGINYIANYQALGAKIPDLVKDFTNNKLAIAIHIPVSADTRRFGITYEIDATAAMTSDKFTATIRLVNADAPFLATVMQSVIFAAANQGAIYEWSRQLDGIAYPSSDYDDYSEPLVVNEYESVETEEVLDF